jgi:hypothetical protein
LTSSKNGKKKRLRRSTNNVSLRLFQET